ncbi:hypothetical protein [Floccifex sp.]|uniref:hypothetical protein n=1 Tax=Floccifex sp. TaxID=2815810 RepID=UPI002A75CA03|nr:hypothetical protein [Floccifex sp.]MDD7282151.1 hypothetical protein [Erysipelotrichaceae bacterium]MDY2959044.1 hypothetical protein [Floccifex sp.]
MKQNNKASFSNTILSGPNMYTDKFGNTIYYDKRNKLAYKIRQDQLNTFKTYQSRFVLCIIAFVLLYILFELNIFLSLGITVVIGIFLEYKFRSFLKQLPKSTNFDKKDRVKPVDQMIEASNQDLLIRFGLYAALGILLIVNTFISDNVKGKTAIIVFSYLAAAFAIFMAYKYISLIIRKKKQK